MVIMDERLSDRRALDDGLALGVTMAAGLLVLFGWMGAPLEGKAQQSLPSWASPSETANQQAGQRDQRLRGRMDSPRSVQEERRRTPSSPRFTNAPGGQPTTRSACDPSCEADEYCARAGDSEQTMCVPEDSNGPPEAPVSGWVWLAAAGLGYGGYRLRFEEG